MIIMINKPFSVLIVDDNKQNLMVLADILENCNYDIGFAMNGKQALDYVYNEKPDLIMLDVMMPEMDGYETCTILKSNPEFKDVPIIFLTAKVEIKDIIKGFEVGGVDYISKPYNSLELKSRVKTHLELKRVSNEEQELIEALKEANKKIENQNNELNKLLKKFEILSKTDSLTGLFNRRCILDTIEQIENDSLINNSTFSIVMSDIDFFKFVNDTYGHNFGDEVLKEIANLISSNIRKSDFLSRWGGEEFLIIFSNTTIDEAQSLAEKIRKIISEHIFKINENEIKITMTFGVSEYKKGDLIDVTIKKADNALYKGKNSGRNIVEIEN